MRSLRTLYTKAVNMPSGSEAGLTERQQEIVERCHFLHPHVRPRRGKTNLKIGKDDGGAKVI